jgi:hypothetical protein
VERRLQDDLEFCGAYKKGLENGRSSLRRIQWKAALAGNTTMQIWLGKQYLGQREPRHEVELNDAADAKQIAELEAILAGDLGLTPDGGRSTR